MAIEWGLTPLDVYQCEFKEIAYFVLAKMGKIKQEKKLEKEHIERIIYTSSTLTARCIAPLLSKKHKMPTFEEVFGSKKEKFNAFEYLVEKERLRRERMKKTQGGE